MINQERIDPRNVSLLTLDGLLEVLARDLIALKSSGKLSQADFQQLADKVTKLTETVAETKRWQETALESNLAAIRSLPGELALNDVLQTALKKALVVSLVQDEEFIAKVKAAAK